MKNFILLIYIIFCLQANAQSSSKIIKLQTVLKTASTVNDLKSLIDGDIAAAICSLLGGPAICDLLSVKLVNENEDAELEAIKSKYELERFLMKNGISPDDFYKKLLEEKNSETIISRLDFLKKK